VDTAVLSSVPQQRRQGCGHAVGGMPNRRGNPCGTPSAAWVALVVGRTQGSAPTEVMQRAMVQIA